MKSRATRKFNSTQAGDVHQEHTQDSSLPIGGCPLCMVAAGMSRPRVRRWLVPALLLGVAAVVVISAL